MTDTNIETSKFLLKEHINYQDGAIVSREVFKNKFGTVTLFAFDKGQGLSDHKTPFEAMAYIIDGEAEIMIAKVPHFLEKGEMIHMPADKMHALKAVNRFKMLLIMINA